MKRLLGILSALLLCSCAWGQPTPVATTSYTRGWLRSTNAPQARSVLGLADTNVSINMYVEGTNLVRVISNGTYFEVSAPGAAEKTNAAIINSAVITGLTGDGVRLAVRKTAGQTNNVFEVQDTNNATLAGISPAGEFVGLGVEVSDSIIGSKVIVTNPVSSATIYWYVGGEGQNAKLRFNTNAGWEFVGTTNWPTAIYGDGGGFTNLKVAHLDTNGNVATFLNGIGGWTTPAGTGGGGGATNAVSEIASNGVSIATGVTSLNFTGSGVASVNDYSTNVTVEITGSGGGDVDGSNVVSGTIADARLEHVKAIAIMGDSRAAAGSSPPRWTDTLSNTPPWTLIVWTNVAVSGSYSSNLVWQYTNALPFLTTHTSTCCVLIDSGVNDLVVGSNALQIWQNLTNVAALISASGAEVGILDLTPYGHTAEDVRLAVNNLIKRSTNIFAYKIPVSEMFPNADNTDDFSDGVHLTAAGNIRKSALVDAVLHAGDWRNAYPVPSDVTSRVRLFQPILDFETNGGTYHLLVGTNVSIMTAADAEPAANNAEANGYLMLQRPGGGKGTLMMGPSGGNGAWIQSRRSGIDVPTTYGLRLNPRGGTVSIGDTLSGSVNVNTTSNIFSGVMETTNGYLWKYTGRGSGGGTDTTNGIGMQLYYNSGTGNNNRQFVIYNTGTGVGLRLNQSGIDAWDVGAAGNYAQGLAVGSDVVRTRLNGSNVNAGIVMTIGGGGSIVRYDYSTLYVTNSPADAARATNAFRVDVTNMPNAFRIDANGSASFGSTLTATGVTSTGTMTVGIVSNQAVAVAALGVTAAGVLTTNTVPGGTGGGGTNSGPIAITNAGTYLTNVSIVASTPAGCVTNATLPYRLTCTTNSQIDNPTGMADGQRITIEFIQDATGSRLVTFDTAFKFGTDITGITLSTTAAKRDFATFVYSATNWYAVGFVRGY